MEGEWRSMVLDIQTIPEGRSVVSQTITLDSYATDLPPFSEKISCEAAIDRSGQTLYVRLHFKGTFMLECSRCLAPFAHPIAGTLQLVVKEEPGRYGPSQDDESIDFYYDSRHFDVDLGGAIYEEIMTSIPLKPLCAEDCRGIELQRGSHASGKDEPDARWEALKKIKR
jgi:uncharacterized metal-binding protein YceD (DUF177 family)